VEAKLQSHKLVEKLKATDERDQSQVEDLIGRLLDESLVNL